MLEHQKRIIAAVANDAELFEKEIRKSIDWLNVDEIEELEYWLRKNYWDEHRRTLFKIFSIVAA